MIDIIGEKTGIHKDYKQLRAEAKERLKKEQNKHKFQNREKHTTRHNNITRKSSKPKNERKTIKYKLY